MDLEKYVKCAGKWSFLVILLVTGMIYLTCTDNWQVYFENAGEWMDVEESPDEEPAPVERVIHNPPLRDTGNRKPGMIPAEALENGWTSVLPGDISGNDAGAVSGGDGAGGNGTGAADGETAGKEASDGEAAGEETGGDTLAEGDNTEPEEIPWYELAYRNPEDVPYMTVDDNYFADAVFLGDSRTVGMYEYGGLKDISTFYASTGLNIYKLMEAKIVEVPGGKDKITVEQALQENHFEKIYLMIGINEMGIGTVDSFMEKYREVVVRLQELQPDAIIYLQGIMKVTTKRSEKGDYIHNEGIEARNAEIAQIADNVRIYYLDVNPYICDETGGMEASYTHDGVHLKAQYVTIWKDYLKSRAVDELGLD